MEQIVSELILLLISTLIIIIQIYATKRIQSIANEQGKIRTQVNNLPDLKSIAQAQAEGKSHVEFRDQKKKDDSERLLSFGADIFKCFEMYMDESDKLLNDLRVFLITAKEDNKKYTINTFEETVISQIYSKYTFTDITELKYRLYFNEYNSTFKESYDNWKKEIQAFDEIMIKARDDCKQIVINYEYEKGINKIIAINNKFIEDTNKTKLHSTLMVEVLEAISNLSSTIRS